VASTTATESVFHILVAAPEKELKVKKEKSAPKEKKGPKLIIVNVRETFVLPKITKPPIFESR